MELRCDVAVTGAGLNGLAAGLALGGPGALRALDVALIDAGDPGAAAPRADGRALAITASSHRMFEALGLWPALAPQAEPLREIIVTDSRSDGQPRPALLRFGAPSGPDEPSAWFIESRFLHDALFDAVLGSPRIRVLANRTVRDHAFGPGLARLTLDDGTVVKAALIVAADGRRSPARAAACIDTVGWDYEQSAIVATIAHRQPHGGRACEHFRAPGPFAILPLPGARSSIVWTERRREAERLMALDDEGFVAELQRRFGPERGDIASEGPRRCYPLALMLARALTGPRLALIGDAAHVIHPIAGLGFNLGLRDAAALADCLGDAVRLGLDPGGAAVLGAYARWRRADTVMTALATDGLNRLFSTDGAALRLIRDAGLQAVDRLGVLKSFFMREAAGQTGDLPRLMRGQAA